MKKEIIIFILMATVFSACSTFGESPVNNTIDQQENEITTTAEDVSTDIVPVSANPETLGILTQDTLSWSDCISLAKNETGLINFITWGRPTSNAELFSRLVDRAFIPYTQEINTTSWPTEKPVIDEVVTRAGAAFFILNLRAEAKADRAMRHRYAQRFANQRNPVSPIADVPVLSPFFNAIFGSVEMEFMSLVDDNNFRPNQPIRGAELLEILRKVEN